MCFTKMGTEKNQSQDCHKRNLVYETSCLTCEYKQVEYINGLEVDEKEKEDMKNRIKKYKYIGETSRSVFERGWEHVNDMAQLKSTSHMLKLAVGVHEGEDMNEKKFGMKVVKYS